MEVTCEHPLTKMPTTGKLKGKVMSEHVYNKVPGWEQKREVMSAADSLPTPSADSLPTPYHNM